jgi:glucokinase
MLLAGDIGGTKTAVAVYSADHGPRKPLAERIFPSADYPSLEAIAREYLGEVDLPVTQACFAVAGPVSNGRATLTNLPWVLEESSLREALGLESVSLLNDVEAMATAVPYLNSDELRTVRQGEPVTGGAIALIAPGTGLGQAFLVWDGLRYRAYPSEAGHADFGPTTAQQAELLIRMQARWGRVSYERVCAGRSIPDLYDFLRDVGQMQEAAAVRANLELVRDRTPTIMAAGLAEPDADPLCRATLDLFVAILGAASANLVLSVLATGGLYIGGGIPQRMLPYLTAHGGRFLAAFQDKGRMSPLLARVPIHVIVEPEALLGAALHGLDITVSAGRVSV